DEVGEMSDEVQAKLLRVLQEREVRPIGATATVRVDVRVLAATHRDLRALVQEGKFRQDLYYRLGVVVARVPPLRERREDIPLLFRHFLEQAARAHGLPAPEVSEEAQARLLAHSWPGNVRELQAHATRFFLTGADPDPRPEGPTGLEGPLSIRLDLARTVPLLSLHDARQVFDRLYVGRVIELHDGNVTAAATTLGLNRSYLFELVKRLGLRTGKP
ncbi:sigma-54-dependent Fis family transcriptional regulator, partial [bacterium]|nr:sigma-54-dependent Fis family transcriptional regulator [bacterium]